MASLDIAQGKRDNDKYLSMSYQLNVDIECFNKELDGSYDVRVYKYGFLSGRWASKKKIICNTLNVTVKYKYSSMHDLRIKI